MRECIGTRVPMHRKAAYCEFQICIIVYRVSLLWMHSILTTVTLYYTSNTARLDLDDLRIALSSLVQSRLRVIDDL